MHGTRAAVDTPIGRIPPVNGLDIDSLDLDPATVSALLEVDTDAWRAEIPLIEAHFEHIGERLPTRLRDQLHALEKRLARG